VLHLAAVPGGRAPSDPSSYFAGFGKAQVSPISCPDNLTFDRAGNLWIATDGARVGSHDGFFAVPVAGPDRGHLKQFLTVPTGAEACGPFITTSRRCSAPCSTRVRSTARRTRTRRADGRTAGCPGRR